MNFNRQLRRVGAIGLICLCLAAGLSQGRALAQERITVAAAADLNHAMREFGAAFERTSGSKVEFVFGSSGNFYAQIRNSAPFDVFLSADTGYPDRLLQEGLAVPGSLVRYARGAIVLWVPASLGIDPAKERFELLLRPAIQKIAIANPAHAPYGRAAEAALRSSGIYDKVATKLILGENISQTMQFVQSGNAQAGLVALSLVSGQASEGRGKYWVVTDSLYPPLNQEGMILKTSAHPAAGRKFLEFLTGPQGRAILNRYGFGLPEEEHGK